MQNVFDITAKIIASLDFATVFVHQQGSLIS